MLLQRHDIMRSSSQARANGAWPPAAAGAARLHCVRGGRPVIASAVVARAAAVAVVELEAAADAEVEEASSPQPPEQRPQRAERTFANTPFEPSTTRYHDANAYWLGRLARLAGAGAAQSEGALLAALRAWDPEGFLTARAFARNDSSAALAAHRDFVAVALAGSANPLDWLRNGLAAPRDTGAGLAHAGFSAALEEIWPEVKAASLAALELPGGGRKPLFITGHSIGGAMATAAALDLVKTAGIVPGVVTFAQPRCLVASSAEELERAYKAGGYYRFQRLGDVMPLLPPVKPMGFGKGGEEDVGYRHVGQTRLIVGGAGGGEGEGGAGSEEGAAAVYPFPSSWMDNLIRLQETNQSFVEGAVDKLASSGFAEARLLRGAQGPIRALQAVVASKSEIIRKIGDVSDAVTGVGFPVTLPEPALKLLGVALLIEEQRKAPDHALDAHIAAIEASLPSLE